MKRSGLLSAMLLVGCAQFSQYGNVAPGRKLPAPRGYFSHSVSADSLLAHLSALASDSLYGRKAGSCYERLAAQYIRAAFGRSGLKPGAPDYYQPFSFTASVARGEGTSLAYSGPYGDGSHAVLLQPDIDYRPLGFSASQAAEGPLFFAGYGIRSENPVYDDYAAADVTGKIVLILRYSPDGTNPHGPFGTFAPLRRKVQTARELGAAGVLIVTGPEDDDRDVLSRLRYDRGGHAGLPVMSMTRRAADLLLAGEGISVGQLQREINASRQPHSSEVQGVRISFTVDLSFEEAESRNVLAVLPGAGELKDEWVILGAHYDHLGWGGEGSHSLAPDTLAIHNGADDNASGCALLLELARYFVVHPPAGAGVGGARRSLLFQAYGAEELGLLGSAYYANHPTVPLADVAAMINLDMVGRLQDGKLVIGGAGTSSLWKDLLPRLNSDSLRLTFDDEGFGSSDHQSFYLKECPVLFFFTGAHAHYHRPSDDVEHINLAGMQQLGSLIIRLVGELSTRRDKPLFARQDSVPPVRGRFTVQLGTMPDYTYEGEGLKLAGTRPGSPADRGGLKAGDTIIRFGGREVNSIYDYMYALEEAQAGKPLIVVVRRGTEELQLEVVPERRRD